VTQKTHKRRWLAVLLALYPGLGHVYLREWFRAMVWFGLVITSTVLLVPPTSLPETMSVTAVATASRQLSEGVVVVVLGITVLSMVDAYWIATRGEQASEEGVRRCPSCSKETDEELDFCHWCTTRLSEPDDT